jgi:hypothetical protein
LRFLIIFWKTKNLLTVQAGHQVTLHHEMVAELITTPDYLNLFSGQKKPLVAWSQSGQSLATTAGLLHNSKRSRYVEVVDGILQTRVIPISRLL